ncbi:NADP-dependent oxidoreductase [Cohnella ginsengisoli]|uniref:NADP-dependent oxidoreductase n=1 Tax=Cohnella ginsengisoli TaxID=425004 RepID=A0A9X4KMU2_9BACL|nr:NADP-dependent oxidoreductase [Cohnella ginsengisoli]MDG0792465.1 NADP-dependent oxidoreductase [Cohnella ginsengisoli]
MDGYYGMTRMNAVRFHAYGPPDTLRLEQVARPVAGPGEVLVRVRASGVNPGDWQMRSGWAMEKFGLALTLPFTPGYDLAGVVEAAGPGAERYRAGDRVYGMTATAGAYAEYAAVPESRLAPLPGALDDEQAAGVPMSAFTAWTAVHEQALLAPGRTALINGASGGVGHFAVQFAKLAGARVIAVTSGRNRAFAESLGADSVFDYTTDDWRELEGAADAVIDTFGGERTDDLVRAVRKDGTLVPIGWGQYSAELAENVGARVQALRMAPFDADRLKWIGELIVTGDLRVEIGASMPLAESASAHALSESRRARGKIVLRTDA